MSAKKLTIGIIGNPNSGKSTIFNGLTGSRQHIGNWAGVTVEKKEGEFTLPSGKDVTIVDTPGIYSLSAVSEDEKATLSFALSREANFFINVLDATTIERNLYLTMLLCELKVPMVVVVTMMDIVKRRGIQIDLEHLSQHLGVPVVGVNATDKTQLKNLARVLEDFSYAPKLPNVQIVYPNELENEIDTLSSATVKTAEAFKVERRWVAIKALEGDPLIHKAIVDYHDLASEVLNGSIARCTDVLKESPDVVLADSRYGIIAGLVKDVVSNVKDRTYFSEKIDKFVLNQFVGIPFFLLMMYIVFWLVQTVGGAFIDFFDIAGGTIFVEGSAFLLEKVNSPSWLIGLISNGLGSALQTVGTFLPPIFFMFLCLSILEDSGYMARAAFVMDRFMRWIGLPGKSFVPMLVGFGCSVPAIMATRTLDSKRDRFLTVFMIPFMSCGAKLPVWTLFGAAFCAENPGSLVFWIYASGIILGVVTGLLMKHTLFQGEPTHFIMELPPYHMPRPKHILMHTTERLKIFITRAGMLIVPMVLLLGVLNTIGTDGSIGNEDTPESVLSYVGKKVTPIFEPIGVEKDNWQATVSIFSGLFAKEAVIGTMKGLYGQSDAKENKVNDPEETKEEFSLIGGIKEAFATIPENLSGVWSGFFDPVGLKESMSESAEDKSTLGSLRKHFPKGYHQAFAFLLFVLLYIPCLAATGVVFREIGKFYGALFVGYLTILGWSVATIYYAIAVTGSMLWLSVAVLLLTCMFGGFWLYGRKHKIDML